MANPVPKLLFAIEAGEAWWFFQQKPYVAQWKVKRPEKD